MIHIRPHRPPLRNIRQKLENKRKAPHLAELSEIFSTQKITYNFILDRFICTGLFIFAQMGVCWLGVSIIFALLSSSIVSAAVGSCVLREKFKSLTSIL